MSDDVDDNLEFKRGVAQWRPNATTRAAMAEARTMDEKDAEIAKLRAALTKAVEIAREGCLVPPDGGSPTEEAREMCERIAERIAALLR
jgi:hypothetical protein